MTPKELRRVFSLEGRGAVVTGGASGIGRATCEVLAAAGAGVVVGDVDEAGSEKTVAAIVAAGGRAEAQRCDITSRRDLDALVDRCVDEFGRLDAMCNVAGVAADGAISDIDEDMLDRSLAVNLKGTVLGCQAALRVMVPRGTGAIVNVSSTAIDAPAPRYGVYSMTKAAVAMLGMTLAQEVGRYGIRVNTIAPGFTVTAFTSRHLYEPDGTLNQEKYDAFIEQMKKLSPLKLVGEPEDQAYLILYLVSDAARFVTGQIFRANGGQAMAW